MQVISGTINGAGLPVLVQKAGGELALTASTAIITIDDITGLLNDFDIATLMFF